jgi:hypothetical protein
MCTEATAVTAARAYIKINITTKAFPTGVTAVRAAMSL